MEWAYANGFTAESAKIMGVTDDNKDDYLSDYDYYKSWPLNSWSRIWINYKLTLKYTLSKSELSEFMPNYYCYSAISGLRVLMDNDAVSNSNEDFLKTLKDVGIFACKPCNGTQSAGFFKLSYNKNCFFINDEKVDEKDIIRFVNEHPNYIFTEYLKPHEEIEKFGDKIHTLRVVVMNTNGNNPKIIGAYFRCPCAESGAANYIFHDGTNNDKYNIYSCVDFEKGVFEKGMMVYPNKVEFTDLHPDTGASLTGILENAKEIKTAALEISKWYSNIEFIAFDFGITTNGIKIMEINTHPAVSIFQIYKPAYFDSDVYNFFNDKLALINNFNSEELINRNNLPR